MCDYLGPPAALIDFDINFSALTIGDVEVIEYALRTALMTEEGATFDPALEDAVIATLRKVERMARPKAVG